MKIFNKQMIATAIFIIPIDMILAYKGLGLLLIMVVNMLIVIYRHVGSYIDEN